MPWKPKAARTKVETVFLDIRPEDVLEYLEGATSIHFLEAAGQARRAWQASASDPADQRIRIMASYALPDDENPLLLRLDLWRAGPNCVLPPNAIHINQGGDLFLLPKEEWLVTFDHSKIKTDQDGVSKQDIHLTIRAERPISQARMEPYPDHSTEWSLIYTSRSEVARPTDYHIVRSPHRAPDPKGGIRIHETETAAVWRYYAIPVDA